MIGFGQRLPSALDDMSAAQLRRLLVEIEARALLRREQYFKYLAQLGLVVFVLLAIYVIGGLFDRSPAAFLTPRGVDGLVLAAIAASGFLGVSWWSSHRRLTRSRVAALEFDAGIRTDEQTPA